MEHLYLPRLIIQIDINIFMRLIRELSLFEVTIYGIGIILGAGVYALIGEASGLAGNSLWLSFAIGALISSFTGLSYAELSTIFPKVAAEYVYVRRAFHSRFSAFLLGWLIIFTEIVSASTVALGFAGYFKGLFGFAVIPVALILILILSYINFLGIKESSRFNIIFTGIEIFGLILIIFLGFNYVGKVDYFETPYGMKGVFSAAALVFFAYIGFEDIVNIAEETKKPRKVLPRALILAIVITTLLYVFTSISAVSIVNWKSLSESEAPLALAASKVLGNHAFLLLSFIALAATTNTVLILLIVATRMIYGMAREKALPGFLASIHNKTRTPWLAALITMFFSLIFIFFGDIAIVANMTSLGAFITFASVNLSLIWLRYKKPKIKRGFRVPLNIGNFPVLAFLGLISCLFMILQFDLTLIIFGLIVIVTGAVVYKLLIKRYKLF